LSLGEGDLDDERTAFPSPGGPGSSNCLTADREMGRASLPALTATTERRFSWAKGKLREEGRIMPVCRT
jgi:hypothetical protein